MFYYWRTTFFVFLFLFFLLFYIAWTQNNKPTCFSLHLKYSSVHWRFSKQIKRYMSYLQKLTSENHNLGNNTTVFYFPSYEELWWTSCLTHRNIKVMKLFAVIELVRVVKLVWGQEFTKKFAVDIREGSHIVGKTWRNFYTGVATIVFVLNKIPPNACDIQVGKFTYHEVGVEKVANRSLTESCKEKVKKEWKL